MDKLLCYKYEVLVQVTLDWVKTRHDFENSWHSMTFVLRSIDDKLLRACCRALAVNVFTDYYVDLDYTYSHSMMAIYDSSHCLVARLQPSVQVVSKSIDWQNTFNQLLALAGIGYDD